MKKLIIALTVVVSTVAFAVAHETKVSNKVATVAGQVHCYVMQQSMMVCYGPGVAAMEAMKLPVTLSNGTVIDPKGTVTPKGGKPQTLSSGQCVDLNGNVADVAKHDK